jgi:hypothetical protein
MDQPSRKKFGLRKKRLDILCSPSESEAFKEFWGASRLPRVRAKSLMDSNAFDEVSGICRRHIDHVESGAVWRHLDIQVPATTSSARQVGGSAAV